MKKILFFIWGAFSANLGFSQNTLPGNGNVGIGTLTPGYPLEVNGDIKLSTHSQGYLINYASLSESVGGASTILGNNVKAANSYNRVKRFYNANDPGSYVSLNYYHGITFHTGVVSDLNADVLATDNEVMRITHTGNVGIGTVAPLAKFTVAGGSLANSGSGLSMSSNLANGRLTSGNVHSIHNFLDHESLELSSGSTQRTGIAIEGQTSSFGSSVRVFTGNNERFRIDPNGNVAIGTTDPKGYKLAVAGNMIAESVKVSLQGTWPDYVFAKDYQLPTLQETEKHIKDKGHLPGIPSAAEVKAYGVDLGEMNAKLLQKIEELTLHLIEMKKENIQDKVSISELKALTDKLQLEVNQLKMNK